VSVGEEKESKENMVAEKYIKELKPHSCCNPCNMHAIVKARRFPSTRNRSRQPRGARASNRSSAPGGLCRFVSSFSSVISLSISRRIRSTVGLLPLACPWTLLRINLASFSRLALTSHRGVSGRNSKIKSWISPGRAPSPTIHRHPDVVEENSHPIT